MQGTYHLLIQPQYSEALNFHIGSTRHVESSILVAASFMNANLLG